MSKQYKPFEVNEHLGGKQAVYKFANGYGASVVNHRFAYGGLELAVLRFIGKGDKWAISYATPVADDVIGHLNARSLETKLDAIATLSKSKPLPKATP